MLGVATLRAHVLPKTCGIALILAGGITLFPLPIDGPAFEIIIGAAFAVAAVRAFQAQASARLAPQPAA